QHRRSPGNRETGASGGGQNRAEQHPIPIHPSGSPSPPRPIQNKLLIAISESRKSRRNSVHPVNAGLNVLDSVSKAGAKFKSLADSWADTTTPHGELMITILAGLATFERHLIKARTDEGRKRAQARGVRFGHSIPHHRRSEALDQCV